MSKTGERSSAKLGWQATEVLRALKAMGAHPGRIIERETLLRHNLGGMIFNQGVEQLQAADLVAVHPDAIEITARGRALIA